jgi:hypothetical protein
MSGLQIASDIEQMTSLMTHIINLSKQIGGFNDGPQLREEIQSDVRTLTNTIRSTKDALTALKSQNAPGVDEHQARLDALRARMQAELPGVVNKLRQNTDTPSSQSPARAAYTQPLMSQQLLDSETDQLELLEQQVNEILRVMREVNQLFTTTMEELQKQRHILATIEGATSDAVEKMETGNEELKQAHSSQKKSTKCICAIAVIVIVVAIGVALIIFFSVRKSSGGGPAPTPGPTLVPAPGAFFLARPSA